MDKGYSNLLTEILPAGDIDYEDAADLQIVCPACREPVYKAVRRVTPEIHYLAHYESSRSLVMQCELRVAGMGSAYVSDHNTTARNQNIEFFLSVFRDMLNDLLARHYEPLPAWQTKALEKNKNIKKFAIVMHSYVPQWEDSGMMALHAERFFKGTGRTELTPKDKHLGAARQAAIAQDILKTLLGSASRSNFDLLIARCWAIAAGWVHQHGEEEALSMGLSNDVQEALFLIPSVSSRRGQQMMFHIQKSTGVEGAKPGLNALALFMYIIICDTLLAMDYLGWLTNRSEGRNETG